MRQLSIARLIGKRLADDWKLLLSVFIGTGIATTVAAATPVYLDSLEQLSFHTSLDRLPSHYLDISVSPPNVPLTQKAIREIDHLLEDSINRHISPVVFGWEKYLKGGNSLVGMPQAPLPEGGGTGILLSRGYIQLLSNLESHSRFLEGKMAGNDVLDGDQGPEIESVISYKTAQQFSLIVGDVVELTPSLSNTFVISAQIVGILEPNNRDSQYWTLAEAFLDPPPLSDPPPLLVQIDPDESPVGLFVTRQAIIQVMDQPSVAVPLDRESYFRGDVFLAGLPSKPLPIGGGNGVRINLGFLQHLSNLQDHVSFTKGRMALNEMYIGPNGPVIEAVIPLRVAKRLGVDVGELVTVSPTFGAATVTSVEITGLFEPNDSDDVFWTGAQVFLEPSTLSVDIPVLVQENSDQKPLGLFVTQEAMVKAVSKVQPGALVSPLWSVILDKERLKEWTVSQARSRFKSLGDEIVEAMPGSEMTTGIVAGLTSVGERRSFFSRIPLLLILTIMVVTVLIFLSMMVTYLAQRRRSDTLLLKSRGLTNTQNLQLYAVEGLVMIVLAGLVAPFLAISVVAFAGVLPFFSEFTGGGLMPVRIYPAPFLVASAVASVSLCVFILLSLLGARSELLVRRLVSARPSPMSFFHRYNMDLGLLIVGGLVFWELSQRGEFVTHGLFRDVEVNEVLLLAPMLFLVVVALLLVRFFPIVIRYVSGESLSLVHMVSAGSISTLVIGILWRNFGVDASGYSSVSVLLLLLIGAVYWVNIGSKSQIMWFGGVVIEACLVAGFLVLTQLESIEVLFAPTLGLILIIPAQVVFVLLRTFSRLSPVWLVMSLRHMARNPTEYTWLMLLLVVVMGLGVLSTTVGGTLERSHIERVQYDVPSDVRVSVLSRPLGGPKVTADRFIEIPGVNEVSAALRGTAVVGPISAELLAVESEKFADISWYREDFSVRPFKEIMEDLHPSVMRPGISIPVDASELGLWVKPQDLYPFISIYIGVEDIEGTLGTVILGSLGPSEWTLMQGEIPTDLKPPLKLIGVEMFESGLSDIGGQGTPGVILLDDIHVVSMGNEDQILEDFEGELRWLPIITSTQSTENVTLDKNDTRRGNGALALSFGSRSAQGFRGAYFARSSGPLPAVVSNSLLAATGYNVGDSILAQLESRWIPVTIVDSVDFFPTLDPTGGGFLLVDLYSLTSHTNVLIDFFSSRPDEIYISDTRGGHEAVLEAAAELGEIYDSTEQIESIRLDPYVTAGWRPMVFLSPVVGVIAAGVGYVAFLLMLSRRRWGEIGSMRSLGLTSGQLLGMLGFEQLVVVVVGLGLGAWSGFQMCRLMVSPLVVTESGDPIVPSFILTTDWSVAISSFIVLLIIFVVALFGLNRAASRIRPYLMAKGIN